MTAAFGFILGSILGSFIKATSDRISREKTILGRSYCPHCKKTLRWFDLFPILSYLLLLGKCRYCHKKIPLENLIVELILGIIFAVFLMPFNPSQLGVSLITLGFQAYLIVVFAIIFLIDWRTGLIPDRVTYPAIVISTLFLLFTGVTSSWESAAFSLLSGTFTSLFFIFLIVITRGRGMGWGDVKYVFLLGLALGFPNIIVAIFLAFVLGAVFSIFLLLFGKKHFGQTIPFGPFLSMGGFIALLWGPQIIKWYLKVI